MILIYCRQIMQKHMVVSYLWHNWSFLKMKSKNSCLKNVNTKITLKISSDVNWDNRNKLFEYVTLQNVVDAEGVIGWEKKLSEYILKVHSIK